MAKSNEGMKEGIMNLLIVFLFALPMAVLFAETSMNELLGITFKILAFILLVTYSVLGAVLFNLLDKRGALS